jgi:hypothetical protein
MKLKTTELQGPALDWAVAQAEGNVRLQYDNKEGLIINNILGWFHYRPSVAWEQGGPIIERERISIEDCQDGAGLYWEATRIEPPAVSEARGPTPLIAAMRCYVASKLGDEVEVPDEIL